MNRFEGQIVQGMIPRIYLIKRLRQELLGPKGGTQEQIAQPTDPREEYMTGVLDVANLPDYVPDEESELEGFESLEAEEPAQTLGALNEDEEDSDPLLVATRVGSSPSPKTLPCSIGITFLLQAGAEATLKICVSGGRYSEKEKVWQREPRAWALPPLTRLQWNDDFEEKSHGFRVSVRSKEQRPGFYRVSIYLLNLRDWDKASKRRPSSLLYQPQIRVNLGGEAFMQGIDEKLTSSIDSEEKRLQLLYRNSPILARGHMCAAVWRDIDPEQEPQSPFSWEDFQPGLEDFLSCDLRTEMLPMLSVPTPFAAWRKDLGPSPELSTLVLSKTPPEAIRSALQPLTKAYESWLYEQKEEALSLPETYRDLGLEQVGLGCEALKRIEAGISLLESDSQVHLAFAFANRAVYEQASWQGGSELCWRPFQLGFILLCLGGIADFSSPDREICDLLWFPTGGGKTEAYLALTAFTLGLRRLRYSGYDGVGVLSRYTLRLLSIQQFRRALKLITACEMLRVEPWGELTGWRPEHCSTTKDWLWGEHRFSAGLWLGGSVTPNQCEGSDFMGIPGGFNLLKKVKVGQSDPAQVTECPACSAIFALPEQAEEELADAITLHLRVEGLGEENPAPERLSTKFVRVLKVEKVEISQGVHSLHFELEPGEAGGALAAEMVDSWWQEKRALFGAGCSELCVRPSRPGYYIEQIVNAGRRPKPFRIEIFCPNPDCPTARAPWREKLPLSKLGEADSFQPVPSAVAIDGSSTVARQCPIPALTVDEEIYSWPPSLVVSTVDKFARLSFQPLAASLFGNVEFYHAHEGFYRQGCLRGNKKSKGGHSRAQKLSLGVQPLPGPELIIQDELHLIDGPLGSMMGLYETAVSKLCRGKPKYVASTATVREAADQVQALFSRELRQFPPPSLKADDSFFALMQPASVMQSKGPGRLYLGFSAPGRGAVSPQVRVWAILLQAAQELRELGVSHEELDPYWTPVGYFTTIRNLAATAGQWRQSIPHRLEYLGGEKKREISPVPWELSSRISTSRLPGLLSLLSRTLPKAVDGVLSTSMFGTGVDVSRLSLMLVHGQPKTTSAYIQATGRVGRKSPGLIVTALPATNPRSLDHYEFFTGYHRQLYRGVEPVTVYPFAPRARERGIGPLCVALLRQGIDASPAWRDRTEGARYMANAAASTEVQALGEIFEERARSQPELRRPDREVLKGEVEEAISSWQEAAEANKDLVMEEYTFTKAPEFAVVLGDPQHQTAGLDAAFPNAPQSLRDIEPTMGFKI